MRSILARMNHFQALLTQLVSMAMQWYTSLAQFFARLSYLAQPFSFKITQPRFKLRIAPSQKLIPFPRTEDMNHTQFFVCPSFLRSPNTRPTSHLFFLFCLHFFVHFSPCSALPIFRFCHNFPVLLLYQYFSIPWFHKKESKIMFFSTVTHLFRNHQISGPRLFS